MSTVIVCINKNQFDLPNSVKKIVEIVVRIPLQSFGKVNERCENHHTKYQEEDKQKELLGACLEGVHENFEARRVTGEFEETKNSNDREEVEQVAVLEAGALQEHVRIERKGGDKIDYVDCVGDECFFIGRYEKADDDLEQKPDIAAELDVEEERIRLGTKLFQEPGVARCFVAYFGYSPGRGGEIKINQILNLWIFGWLEDINWKGSIQ